MTTLGGILWVFVSVLGSSLWDQARHEQHIIWPAFIFWLNKLLQLFCVIADNASNNDTACDTIERLLYWWNIYSFNSFSQHLFCLALVINLGVTDVMAMIRNWSMTWTIMLIVMLSWYSLSSLLGVYCLFYWLDINVNQTSAIAMQWCAIRTLWTVFEHHTLLCMLSKQCSDSVQTCYTPVFMHLNSVWTFYAPVSMCLNSLSLFSSNVQTLQTVFGQCLSQLWPSATLTNAFLSAQYHFQSHKLTPEILHLFPITLDHSWCFEVRSSPVQFFAFFGHNWTETGLKKFTNLCNHNCNHTQPVATSFPTDQS